MSRPAASPGTRYTYGSYWVRMATAWADRPLDAIVASDIEAPQTAGRHIDIRPHHGMLIIASAAAGRHVVGSRGELPLPAGPIG